MTPPIDESTRYLADLESPDETVRSQAATRLQALGHPLALEACLRTLNDAADELHLDHTPAVACLTAIGPDALSPLLDRLLSDDRWTRLHAQRAVEAITLALPRFQGGDRRAVEARWRPWWKSMGYAWDGDPNERPAAVLRLRSDLIAVP